MAFPWMAAASAVGSVVDKIFGDSAADKNAEMQEEFAKNGIRWRVEDAKRAGIHPLYALGAPTFNASPVYQGTSVADDFANIGQSIERAQDAGSTAPERISRVVAQLQAENMGLQNDLLRSQIAKMNSAQIGPSIPSVGGPDHLIPGQGDSPLVSDQPLKRTVANPGETSQEPGAVTDVGYARTPTGLVPIPSTDIKERIEDNVPQELSHFLRNNILPAIGMGTPPKVPLPKGYRWTYNIMRGEWQAKKEYVVDFDRRSPEGFKARYLRRY